MAPDNRLQFQFLFQPGMILNHPDSMNGLQIDEKWIYCLHRFEVIQLEGLSKSQNNIAHSCCVGHSSDSNVGISFATPQLVIHPICCLFQFFCEYMVQRFDHAYEVLATLMRLKHH